MLTIPEIILVITAIMSGLISGLFYAYSCSVNPGLGRLTNIEYLRAMKSINRAILNPVFFMSFFGTALLLPVTTILHNGDSRFLLLLIATIVYLAGCMGVTMFGNVPLNNSLEAFDLENAAADELSVLRKKFEIPWNNLNTIRTMACVVALILVIIACLKY